MTSCLILAWNSNCAVSFTWHVKSDWYADIPAYATKLITVSPDVSAARKTSAHRLVTKVRIFDCFYIPNFQSSITSLAFKCALNRIITFNFMFLKLCYSHVYIMDWWQYLIVRESKDLWYFIHILINMYNELVTVFRQ